MTTNRELATLYNMITTYAAQAMNINQHSLKVGHPANLVVLAVPNVLEALREHAAPLYTITHGKLIDRARMEAIAHSGEW
jgi:cytosine/adenosine deaminase-related metal-dependent hydrolase